MQKKLVPEQIAKLKEPLPKEAVKPHPTKNYLSSIKAIYVVERLNEVFGLGGWFARNEVVKSEGKMVVVKSTFEAPEYGIMIPDIFGGNDNADLGDAYKGACTDALTKIGSYLYIGMDVYKGLGDKSPDNGATSYNHKKIDTPGKPLITNGQFKTLVDRVKSGDKEAAKKASEAFSFEEKQQSIIESLLKQPA
jgi:hypothetical protein